MGCSIKCKGFGGVEGVAHKLLDLAQQQLSQYLWESATFQAGLYSDALRVQKATSLLHLTFSDIMLARLAKLLWPSLLLLM